MRFNLFFCFAICLFVFSGCSKDDDDNGADLIAGNFEASISGDHTEDVSGSAFIDEEDGETVVTLFVMGGDWSFITFQFDIPITEGEKTLTTDPSVEIGSDEVFASASDGDYFYWGESGTVSITDISNGTVSGNFNVNYEYDDMTNRFEVNIIGTFVAVED